jgi:hypothetical protein
MYMLAQTQADFFRELRQSKCGRRIDALWLYHAAPVLSRVKTAVLLPLQPVCADAWSERLGELCQMTGLCAVEITGVRGNVLLLIYDESALTARLRDGNAGKLLAKYGYPAELDAALLRLKSRFAEMPIPHEIGVFLGYPSEDVQGFIASAGANCLMCRHWKVYHDIERAQEMFRKIDASYVYAIDLLTNATPIQKVAELLKAA